MLSEDGVKAFQGLPTILQSHILLEISVECSRVSREHWEEAASLRARKVLATPLLPKEIEAALHSLPSVASFYIGYGSAFRAYYDEIRRNALGKIETIICQKNFYSYATLEDRTTLEFMSRISSYNSNLKNWLFTTSCRENILDSRLTLFCWMHRTAAAGLSEQVALEKALHVLRTRREWPPGKRFLYLYTECLLRGYHQARTCLNLVLGQAKVSTEEESADVYYNHIAPTPEFLGELERTCDYLEALVAIGLESEARIYQLSRGCC